MTVAIRSQNFREKERQRSLPHSDKSDRGRYLILTGAAEIVASDEERDEFPVVLEVNVALNLSVVLEFIDEGLRLSWHAAADCSANRNVQLRAALVASAVSVVLVSNHLSDAIYIYGYLGVCITSVSEQFSFMNRHTDLSEN